MNILSGFNRGMKLILIFIVLFILILFMRISRYTTEAFVDNLEKEYDDFLKFYYPFCKIWKQAIETSIAVNITQVPLTNPKQAFALDASPAPLFTIEQINSHILELSHKLGTKLPQACIEFPQKIDEKNAEFVLQNIPSDAGPYINALIWMNSHMKNAHSNLDLALKGKRSPKVEGFDCSQIASCLASDPGILQKALDESHKQKLVQIEGNIRAFFSNKDKLDALMTENQELVQKSNKIKEQAQNGELMNQVNIEDNSYYVKPVMPSGGDTLRNLKLTNPAKYSELQKQSGAWFAVKGLMEQINSNLV